MQLNINLSIYFIYFSTYYSNKNYYLQTKGITNITISFLFFFFYNIKSFQARKQGGQKQMKISTVTAQTKRGNRWPVCAEASNRQGEHVARPCFRPHFPCGPVPVVP